MEQEKRIAKISRLIIGHLRGELSKEESVELVRWREGSEENERMFKRLTEGKWLSGRYDQYCLLREVDDWDALKGRIGKRRVRPLRHLLRYAAVACVVFAVAYGGWMLTEGKWGERSRIPVAVKEIVPGSVKAVLEFAGGKQVYLGQCEDEKDRSWLKRYGIEEADSVLVYGGKVAVEEWHALRVPRGGEYVLSLEDGSRVWVNSETILRFPVRFGKGERLVRLEGEAYFEVAKDAGRPFCVETDKGRIHVLGTRFNVEAYEGEEEMTVTLAHGAVKVAGIGEEAMLKPDEQAVVGKNRGIRVEKVDAGKVCAWREGVLHYDSMPLEALTEKLGRWFDCTFVFSSEELKRLTFTGAFRKQESIDYILGILEATTDINMEVKGKTVIVSYK